MSYSAQELLKTYLRDISQKNKVNIALENFIPNTKSIVSLKKKNEIPFSSERKYSACVYDDITLVLGAPEMLLRIGNDAFKIVDVYTRQAYRVLAFGRIKGQFSPHKGDIKKVFEPLGIIALDDPIREETPDTLNQLTKEGIEYRIISGDSPDTVRAIAKKINNNYSVQAISGEELGKLEGEDQEKAILGHNIFARIKPHQKQLIVRTLKKKKLFTIMIGDGVNDVLALKESDLGVAMNAGSSMAKDVADVVLLNNSFSTLPILLYEGRKIITNIQTIAYIYLMKNISAITSILMLGFIGLRFPFDPKHVELSSILIIGLPSLVLAFEKHKFSTTDEGFIQRLLIFSGIVGFGNALIYTMLYTYYDLTSDRLFYSRTMLLACVIFLGINNLILIYLQHYTLSEILKRKILLGLILTILSLFLVFINISAIRNFFEIIPISFIDLLLSFFFSALGSLIIAFILNRIHLLSYGRES